MELIIASNNPGKVREYRDILEPLGFRVFSQQEKGICLEVEETGTTFEENARLKARAVYDLAHCAVISDDSGLQVEALGGEPGIYSARYRGLATEDERRQAVLDGLKGSDSRQARFVCCICDIDASGQEHLFKGVWNGSIATAEDGANGFGYAPIFSPDGKRSFAEISVEEKNTMSHRGNAVKLLREALISSGLLDGND